MTLAATLNRISAKVFWSCFVVIFVAVAVVSFVQQGENSSETKAKRISQQLRCIECEGLSVAQSDTQTSKTIVRDVERRVKEGQSEDEIFAYYEDIYGEFIRLSPTSERGNWLLYVLPISGTVILVGAIYLSRRKDSSKKIIVGFWSAAAIAAIAAVSVFVIDARNESDQASQAVPDQRTLLEKQVRDNPTAENLKNLAIIQFAQEEYVDALKNFDRAAELDPTDPQPRAYAAYIVLQAGEYELALSRAQEAVRLGPDNTVALFFRGVVLYTTPHEDPALEAQAKAQANADFDRVLELAPESEFASQIRELREQ